MREKILVSIITIGGLGIASSCIPAHLQKYRRNQKGSAVSQKTEPRKNSQRSKKRGQPTTPSVYAVDEQTFRFKRSKRDIWDAALTVLLRNYNLNIVDQNSGIITTEWDTFYLDESVYRNKVSLRIQSYGRNRCDVTVHNSVERLQDGAAAGAMGTIWLPSEDIANELARVVQNIAIVLNEPPPSVPGIAKSNPSKERASSIR